MRSGILLIDKPSGLTSRAVDNRIGRFFNTRKVGHLGTLDPFATGLLVLAIDKGTKCLPYLDDSRKSYAATLRLGIMTSTGDPEGEEISKAPIPDLSEKEIQEALLSFLGESMQMPPMTSAIKISGVPLYRLAHKNEERNRPPRKIEVFDISLKSYRNGELSFETTVSRGAYIRVLGEDIAKKLGTVGYLTSLRRLSISGISVKDAIPLDQVTPNNLLNPLPYIALPHHEIDGRLLSDVKNGRPLRLSSEEEKILLTKEGEAIAVYHKEGDLYVAERGLF